MALPDSLVIETHNLTKVYQEVQALKGLDLAVKRHSIFGFLGPNEAGKTTTIKLLLGLARPTSGSATVFGRDIQRESVAIRKRVGYLAQDPRYYERMTAFAGGLFFGVIREKTGTLLAPSIAHGLPDAFGEGLKSLFAWM